MVEKRKEKNDIFTNVKGEKLSLISKDAAFHCQNMHLRSNYAFVSNICHHSVRLVSYKSEMA